MIQLNYRDPRPIYEQVKDGIRKLAYSGVLGPDDKLPSVRELAMKLAINPNTISRAYKELEQEGFIYTVTGRGTFINQEFDLNDSRKEELWQQFDKAAKELLGLSVTTQELVERIAGMNAEKTTILAEDVSKGGSTDDSGK
ncbi:MAG: GntR family transcriptional regulator [Agathobacter sp.]|nr:GntR family transcriptional regulator [Agathobacter sp.]